MAMSRTMSRHENSAYITQSVTAQGFARNFCAVADESVTIPMSRDVTLLAKNVTLHVTRWVLA